VVGAAATELAGALDSGAFESGVSEPVTAAESGADGVGLGVGLVMPAPPGG
jgi:hypothetical protein